MTRKKNVRTRGKVSLSRYFQKLEKNDSVAVIKEPSVQGSFPKRLIGKTGTISGKRGKAYVVELKDSNKEKKFIISPIHLKKIKRIDGIKK